MLNAEVLEEQTDREAAESPLTAEVAAAEAADLASESEQREAASEKEAIEEASTGLLKQDGGPAVAEGAPGKAAHGVEAAGEAEPERKAAARKGKRAPGRKRLLIHAGVHRTGTTSIQHMLSTGRASLESQGVLYPRDFVGTDKQGDANEREKNHSGVVWALNRGELTGKMMTDWLHDVVPSSCNTAVLSAEDFCRLNDVSFLSPLTEAYDVELVFYLRRQDHWLSSWYNQQVRWPFDPKLSSTTPLEFLNHISRFHWLRYFELLERWAAFVGRDKIHVRVAEKGQVSDTSRDFFELVGAKAKKDTFRTNESISAEKLELLRRLRFIRFSTDQRLKVLEALGTIPDKRSTNVYSSGVRRLLAQRYAMQNQLVARHYLGRADGTLFYDNDYPTDADGLDNSSSLDESMVLQLIGALAGRGEGDR